ncbi:MAG: hypothetical protein E7536_09005 [Ruminococcaceae bacterium]|nr:hypothetical protein [Oscillospiraceae bacterium]
MLTKERITEYIRNLENQERELRNAIENHTVTLHAVSGAIQAAKHLLSLSEEEKNEGEKVGDEE